MKVEQLNRFTEIKQPTSADKYMTSGTMVTQRYPAVGVGVTATAGQTIINFGFAVPQDGVTPGAFCCIINGQKLPQDDYSFTNIIAGTSAQVTLVAPLTGIESIECLLLGTTVTAFPNPSTVQAGLNNLYAGLAACGNVFTLPATTNTTYISTSSNNPYTLFFDDGRPLFGVRRFMVGGMQAITLASDTPYDSTGLQGYYLVDASTGLPDTKFRAYGNWAITSNTTNGYCYLTSSTNGAYISITGIFNKMNAVVGTSTASSYTENIYLNGANTGNTITHNNSIVIDGQYYASNEVVNVNIGAVTQNLYNVQLIKNSTTASYFYGFEIINDAYNSSANTAISIPACSKVIQGQVISFPAFTGANSLPYAGSTSNSGQAYSASNSKGARVAWYPTLLGTYTSKVTTAVENVQTGSLAAGDNITGLATPAVYYSVANTQGNIIRVRNSSSFTATMRALLVPTGITSGNLLLANDYTGGAVANVLTNNSGITNKQYEDDGTTAPNFSAGAGYYVDLYANVLANASHANEEFVRDIHVRDFGYGASTDFSTLGGSSANAAAVLDDGITNLVANACYIYTDGGIVANATGSYVTVTFVGSGIDYELSTGYVRKVASDLPYGTHTLKVVLTSLTILTFMIEGVTAGTATVTSATEFDTIGIRFFKVYQPKTPALTGYNNPEFAYNVLANQVLTNLPTRSLSAYNGFVDQGSIKKLTLRESIFVGSSCSITGFSILNPAGYSPFLAGGTTGNFTYNIFGVNKFRFGIKGDAGDTYSLAIDGSTVETNISLVVNDSFIVDSNSTLSALTNHSIQVSRGSTTVGNFWALSLDFNTPIYEPSTWTTNPYLDYFISGTGVGDYRQTSLVPVQTAQREYRAISTLANSTTTSSEIIVATLILDKGKWYLDTMTGLFYPNVGGTCTVNIRVDGAIVSTNATYYGTLNGYASVSNSIELTLTKKSAITITWSPSSSSIQYISVAQPPTFIKVVKNSN